MGTSIFKVIPHKDADTVKLIERLNYIRNPIPDKWYHGMMLLGMCVVSLIGMHPLLLLLAAV